jgi:hypothetical protein
MTHQLDGAFARVDRAGEHLGELKTIINAFRQGRHDARSVILDPDFPKDGNIEPEWPVFERLRIAIVVGEICYNLRSALDYLIYELALLDSREVQKETQFLIEYRPKDFKSGAKLRLKGLNARHKACIKALQPYNGCDWVGNLKEISNPDKHRTLTAIGYRARAAIGPVVDRGTFPSADMISSEHSAEGTDGTKMDVQLVTSVTVTISIKNVAVPIVEALQVLHSQVTQTLDAFKPEFE